MPVLLLYLVSFSCLFSGGVVAGPVGIAELLTEIRNSSALRPNRPLSGLHRLSSMCSRASIRWAMVDAQGPVVGGSNYNQRDYDAGRAVAS